MHITLALIPRLSFAFALIPRLSFAFALPTLLTATIALTFFPTPGFSQHPKYFEGTIVYKVWVQSRVPELGPPDIHKLFLKGDQVTATFKDGNGRFSSGFTETYTIAKDKRQYYKFRNLDTLYYLDFSGDTSQVTGFEKPDSNFRIDNYPCKIFIIRTANISRRIYYAPDLRLDPSYSQDNTLDHVDLFVRETGGGGIYLWERTDLFFGSSTDSCIHIENRSVDDHIFDLPALPQKKLTPSEMVIPVHFPGKEAGWLRYLQANLDSKVALKYVKIAKDQSEASQKVVVSFYVAEDGTVSDLKVVNQDEVNSHLAEEAMRVIRESPRWVPFSYFGEKIKYFIRQSVVFKVTR